MNLPPESRVPDRWGEDPPPGEFVDPGEPVDEDFYPGLSDEEVLERVFGESADALTHPERERWILGRLAGWFRVEAACGRGTIAPGRLFLCLAREIAWGVLLGVTDERGVGQDLARRANNRALELNNRLLNELDRQLASAALPDDEIVGVWADRGDRHREALLRKAGQWLALIRNAPNPERLFGRLVQDAPEVLADLQAASLAPAGGVIRLRALSALLWAALNARDPGERLRVSDALITWLMARRNGCLLRMPARADEAWLLGPCVEGRAFAPAIGEDGERDGRDLAEAPPGR